MSELIIDGEVWIGTAEAAKILGIHQSSVNRAMDAHLFNKVRRQMVGKTTMIHKGDLEEVAPNYVKRNAWRTKPKKTSKPHTTKMEAAIKANEPGFNETMRRIEEIRQAARRRAEESNGRQD